MYLTLDAYHPFTQSRIKLPLTPNTVKTHKIVKDIIEDTP
jgi:hypothetical protein